MKVFLKTSHCREKKNTAAKRKKQKDTDSVLICQEREDICNEWKNVNPSFNQLLKLLPILMINESMIHFNTIQYIYIRDSTVNLRKWDQSFSLDSNCSNCVRWAVRPDVSSPSVHITYVPHWSLTLSLASIHGLSALKEFHNLQNKHEIFSHPLKRVYCFMPLSLCLLPPVS